jgi:acyl-CoA thioesterase-1
MQVSDGWVYLLQQRLDSQQINYRVINASISGDTTAGGLARLAAPLKRHRPKIIILELGANDGLRGLSLAQMKQNLEKMITLSKENGATVILTGMQLPPNYGPLYTNKFQQTYRELASEHNVLLVPFLLENVGGKSSLIQADGLHPNEKAQPIILENIWQELKQALHPQTAFTTSKAR